MILKNLKLVKNGNSYSLAIPISLVRHGIFEIGNLYDIELVAKKKVLKTSNESDKTSDKNGSNKF